MEFGIGEILLVESGIGKTFACGIRDSGFYNPEYSSRNPESGIHGVESSPRLHWIPLSGATTRAAYGAKRETCDEAEVVNLCDKKSPTYTHASPEAKWN